MAESKSSITFPKRIVIKPQPGAQTEFLKSGADIVIYGGAAFGGKTFGLLMTPVQFLAIKNFGGVIFRRTYADIKKEGALLDESKNIYAHIGGMLTHDPLRWTFPSGSKISFNHIEHEKNIYSHQGGQYAFIGFDELTHFTEKMFFYLLGRNRTSSKVSPFVRATCNPDPDSWVSDFISWWIDQDTGLPIKERSGVIRYFSRVGDRIVWGRTENELISKYKLKSTDLDPSPCKSCTFISANIYDNIIGMENDPSYISNLMILPEVEKQQLLYGNWKIKRQGTIFKNPKFTKWNYDIDCVMYVDPAFGGNDRTSVTVIGLVKDDLFQVTGHSWKENCFDLIDEITSIAKNYFVGTIYVESNADKGAFARDLRNHWSSVQDIDERVNKHVRIMDHCYRNWNRLYFDELIYSEEEKKRYINNILAYEENCGIDDEIDSLAGAVRAMTQGESIYAVGKL